MPLSQYEAVVDNISETAIVDFQVHSPYEISREAYHLLFHIHINGKCVKNRFGEHCN